MWRTQDTIVTGSATENSQLIGTPYVSITIYSVSFTDFHILHPFHLDQCVISTLSAILYCPSRRWL